MTITTKTFNVFAQTKNITEEDGVLYIEGIANTGKADLVGDIVTKTALQQIVEQAPQRNLHYNHESGKKDLLGRIKEAELRPEGAWIKTRILDEQKDWLQSYIDQEIIFGQSISGCCSYEEGSIDNIISWELTEVSLTDTPCDPGTMGTVSISKSFDDLILSLKRKQELKETDKMADDNVLSKDDIIEIINDAYNERKEELMESIREEVGKEYDVKFNEISDRLTSIESRLDANEPQDPPADPDPADPEDGKAFEEAVEKAVQERLDKAVNDALEKHAQEKANAKVKEILEGIVKDVNPQYNRNEHIEDKKADEEIEDKAYPAEEIAEMLG